MGFLKPVRLSFLLSVNRSDALGVLPVLSAAAGCFHSPDEIPSGIMESYALLLALIPG